MSRRRGADTRRDLTPKVPVEAFAPTYEALIKELQRRHPDWDTPKIEAFIRERADPEARRKGR